MIVLSYETKPINPGVPLRHRPIVRRRHYFYAAFDSATVLFPALEQKLMHDFRESIKSWRKIVDVDIYPGARGGHRFAQGNSSVTAETCMGSVVKICLSYADIEDNDRRRSPSHFTSGRIGEMARQLINRAPRLVVCHSSFDGLIETSLTRDRLPKGSEGRVIPFPAAWNQPRPQ